MLLVCTYIEHKYKELYDHTSRKAFVLPVCIGLLLVMVCSIGNIIAQDAVSIPFDDALAYIEYNSYNGDLGLHVDIDVPAWSHINILDPDGNAVFSVNNDGNIREQGLTHVFFESAEYPFDELSYDDFLARFPEGEYTLTGETLDGQTLQSPMPVTHDIPEPPQITSPADGAVINRDEVIIVWNSVALQEGIEFERYQLILFPVDPPKGQDPIEMDIDLTFEFPAFVTETDIRRPNIRFC